MKVRLVALLLLTSSILNAQDPETKDLREAMSVLYRNQIAKDREQAKASIRESQSDLAKLIDKAIAERNADIESLTEVRKYYRSMDGYRCVYDSSTGKKLGFVMESSRYKGRIKVQIGRDIKGLESISPKVKSGDLKAVDRLVKDLPWHDEPSATEDGEDLLEVSEEASTARQLLSAVERWKESIEDARSFFKSDYRPRIKPFDLRDGQIGDIPPLPGTKVFQVTGDDSMLVSLEYGRNRVLVYCIGLSTAGKADGQRIKLEGVFLVDGTRTYETTGGSSKTVFVIRPMILK